MRIFVLEYATGGGVLERPGLANCRAEGDAMLRRLVTDLADIPGTGVEVATDDAMTEDALSGRRVHCHRITSGAPVRSLWEDILAKVDAIWAIAPETAGILADLTAWAEQRGCIVLGSPSQAVKIATSKLATARHLALHDIPVVPTYQFDMTSELPASAAGWVVKPDDGIGGAGARYLATAEDARRWRRGTGEEFAVIQPFLPGAPISVSCPVSTATVRVSGRYPAPDAVNTICALPFTRPRTPTAVPLCPAGTERSSESPAATVGADELSLTASADATAR